MYIEKVKDLVKELGHLAEDQIIPCSEEEVNRLEKLLKFKLPLAYREFLLWAGYKLGNVNLCNSFSYNNVLFNSEDGFNDVISQDDFDLIPDDIIVLYITCQNTGFEFITSSEGDDPPVYMYNQ